MSLDPDDPRPPYQQVANALRAAILTGKFSPGEQLPSQTELATGYGVARMTIQHALRLLKTDGLISSRQGSGVFVRARTERATELGPHLASAFEANSVTIDFAGMSAETLHGALIGPLDKIRVGRLTPSAVSVRILLPDFTQPLALPQRAGNPPKDDPAVRARSLEIAHRHAGGIVDEVHELATLGLVERATAEVRVIANAATEKLYIINNSETFYGRYIVIEREVVISGRKRRIYDAMGKDMILNHHAADDDPTSADSQQVSQSRAWFDSVWTTIAQPATL